MKKVVMVCGHFDPLHRGHIEHMRRAKKLGDVLLVVVGTDQQLLMKYDRILQPLHERVKRVFRKAPFIDGVVVSIDEGNTQAETIKMLRPHIFAKGGDRIPGNMPQVELDACNEIGCKVVYGVGGQLCSSTQLRKRMEAFGAIRV